VVSSSCAQKLVHHPARNPYKESKVVVLTTPEKAVSVQSLQENATTYQPQSVPASGDRTITRVLPDDQLDSDVHDIEVVSKEEVEDVERTPQATSINAAAPMAECISKRTPTSADSL
jgi:hypothetical protein